MINGKHVPGQGLPGSIVSIKDRTAIGVKNNNGTFSFPVTDNQFRVDSVKKKDYVLLDADVASKTYIKNRATSILKKAEGIKTTSFEAAQPFFELYDKITRCL